MSGSQRVVLTPAAEVDAEDHRDWYRRERADRPDLLELFDERLLDALDAVGRNPEAFAADPTGCRHVRFRRMPYSAFFRIEPEQSVVFAVLHDKQDPKTWRSRL